MSEKKNYILPKNIIFKHKDFIFPSLFCKICNSLMLEPLRLKCNCVYCKSCINNPKRMFKCKIHKTMISHLSQTKTPIVIKNLIYELIVLCNKSNCNWEGKLEDLENHGKNCNLNN